MKKLYENIVKAIQYGLTEGLFDDEIDDILDAYDSDVENILADKIAYNIRDVHDDLEILFQRYGSLFHDVIIKICNELGIDISGNNDPEKDIWCQSNFCRIEAYNGEKCPSNQTIKYTVNYETWQHFESTYPRYLEKQNKYLQAAKDRNKPFEESAHLAFVTTYSFPSLFNDDLKPVIRKLNKIFKYEGKCFKRVVFSRVGIESIFISVDPIKDNLKEIIRQAKEYLAK